jgi:deoxyribodipyrimidine photolyase-related protein
MKESVLIFPTQLFRDHPSLAKGRQAFLIEEKRFFTDFKFHKKKLMLHRASMKA